MTAEFGSTFRRVSRGCMVSGSSSARDSKAARLSGMRLERRTRREIGMSEPSRDRARATETGPVATTGLSTTHGRGTMTSIALDRGATMTTTHGRATTTTIGLGRAARTTGAAGAGTAMTGAARATMSAVHGGIGLRTPRPTGGPIVAPGGRRRLIVPNAWCMRSGARSPRLRLRFGCDGGSRAWHGREPWPRGPARRADCTRHAWCSRMQASVWKRYAILALWRTLTPARRL